MHIATRDRSIASGRVRRLALTWTMPVILAAVSLLAGWRLMGGPAIDFHVPLMYSDDGLLVLTLIKRLMENLWIFHSTSMGYPFGSTLYDYPIPDSGSLLALKVLGAITGSANTAFDIYYFSGFPIDALAAYAVFRYLKISRPISAAGGFVFTILPFHFLRLPHLFYTWYFPAPCFIAFALRIFSGDLDFFDGKRRASRTLMDVGALALLSCFGVYYSCFGVIAMAAAGVARAAQTRSLWAARTAIAAAVVVTLGVVANVAPNIAYRAVAGINHETAQRQPSESELYGLKIAQLLLPRQDHRFAPFSKLTHRYSSSYPLVNENGTSSLGIIGSLGFLTLLAAFFLPTRRTPRQHHFYALSLITFSLLLFCTVGGFSSLFNLIISPMIRAWNRASVFIGFTSICAALLIIDSRLNKIQGATIITAVASVALALFATWDQTIPACGGCIKANHQAFQSDANFVSAIEKRLPGGSSIYQLPYVPFPEAAPSNRLGSYDLARGYLHSSALNWSFGAIKGRLPDLFFRELARQPIELQLQIVRRIGFDAVYLDRRGYSDDGAAIEARLTRSLGASSKIVSKDGELAFFDLRGSGVVTPLPADASVDQIMDRAHFVVDDQGVKDDLTLIQRIDFSRETLPDFVVDSQGLSSAEQWGRWSDANNYPYVKLTFTHSLPKYFVLHIRAQAFGPNVGQPVRIVVGTQEQTIVPTSNPTAFALYFENTAGAKTVDIHVPHPESPQELHMSSDSRRLGVGLHSLSVEPMPPPQ